MFMLKARLSLHLSKLGVGFVCWAIVAAAPVRAGLVDLQLRPSTLNVGTLGTTFDVELYAISQDSVPDPVAALSAVINWDETHLRLTGVNNSQLPYLWIFSSFPDDKGRDRLNADRAIDTYWSEQPCTDNSVCSQIFGGVFGCDLNIECQNDGDCRAEDFCDFSKTACGAGFGCCSTSYCKFTGFPVNDGDATYEAWSQLFGDPAMVPGGSGLLVTRFRFEVQSHGTSQISIQLFGGPFTETDVLDGDTPSESIFGVIRQPPVTVTSSACIDSLQSVAARGSRYLEITPGAGIIPLAIRIDGQDDVSCITKYVIPPNNSLGDTPFNWSGDQWGTVLVRDVEIRPFTTYEVSADCFGNQSQITTVKTWRLGDINNMGGEPGGGGVDVDDILLVLAGFRDDFSFATFEATNQMPCDPPADPSVETIDVDDILAVLAGFAGTPYSNFCPAVCP